jgi:hypothetical protein
MAGRFEAADHLKPSALDWSGTLDYFLLTLEVTLGRSMYL